MESAEAKTKKEPKPEPGEALAIGLSIILTHSGFRMDYTSCTADELQQVFDAHYDLSKEGVKDLMDVFKYALGELEEARRNLDKRFKTE